ncbi:MAG: glycosyltransferase family 39 protein [Polyangia bacterium]
MIAKRSAATFLVVLATLLLLPRLYRYGLDDAGLIVNDEAIYCDMAREMVTGGHPSEIRYEGEVYFPRPPAAIWAIAASDVLVGLEPPEHGLRIVTSVLPTIEVLLTVLLGAMLFSPFVGVLGGALLAMSDLFVGYARAFESEPLLVCFVLGAFCAWVGAKRRRWLYVVYGVCLGGALMTKQLIGLFPLAAPVVDGYLALRGERAKVGRGLAVGVAVALLVALPWHLLMYARYGQRFIDSFFVQSLVTRARVSLLWRTTPAFYLVEMWTSERGPFVVWWLGASLLALWVGLRRARWGELFLGGWAIAPLLLYSMARSRYDYYILLSYPAFALSAAWLVAKLPLRSSLRAFVAVALVIVSAALHLPRNLTRNPGTSEERQLLAAASAVPKDVPLYVFNLRPYIARVYTDRIVRVFVDLPSDVPAAEGLRASGMPAPAELANPPVRALELATRPSLLLLPQSRFSIADGVPATEAQLLAESKRYRLYLLPRR